MTCAFLQEFMAALYVFTVFRSESKNVLDSGSLHIPNIFTSKAQTTSVLSLVQSAVELTLSAPLGHYDMFLRFLCGLLSPDCHDKLLGGLLFPHDAAKVSGLEEVQQLLVQTIQTAQQNNTDRLENLEECLRELTQVDEWADGWKPVSLNYLKCFYLKCTVFGKIKCYASVLKFMLVSTLDWALIKMTYFSHICVVLLNRICNVKRLRGLSLDF